MEAKIYLYSRFSSRRQSESDSTRRQSVSTAEFARDVGLPIAEPIHDDAKSAYTGAHRTKGKLGVFADMVDRGLIAEGSYLVLDSIDRMTRESQTEFLHLLTGLLRRGIQVASVADRLVVNSNSDAIDLQRVMWAAELARKESEEKGRKVAAAHQESKRRARDEGIIWHRSGPFWLRAVDGSGLNRTWDRVPPEDRRWDEIPDRVEQVRRIFELREAGLGTTTIAVRLNEDGVGSPKGRQWHHSAVLELLKNRTVLGEYQPKIARKGVRGSRRPKDGDPVPGYYPEIITEAQFHRVQALIAGSAPQSGRKANAVVVNNLFQGISRCGVCGGSFGAHRVRDTVALRCADSARGLCTNKGRFPYPAVESAILREVAEFELPRVDADVRQASGALAVAKGRLGEVNTKLGHLYDQTEAGKSDDILRELIRKRQAERDALKAEVERLEREVGIQANRVAPEVRRANIEALIQDMSAKEGRDLYELRSRLASTLKEVITSVDFHPPKVMTLAKGEGESFTRELPASFTVSVLGGLGEYNFAMTPERTVARGWGRSISEVALESPRDVRRYGLDDPAKKAKVRRAVATAAARNSEDV